MAYICINNNILLFTLYRKKPINIYLKSYVKAQTLNTLGCTDRRQVLMPMKRLR